VSRIALPMLLAFACSQRQPVSRAATTPSFKTDILPVFARSCVSMKGCHGDAPTESVDLDLRAAAAYSQLVSHAAQARKTAVRVAPGDPAASFLVAKLTGSLAFGEGKSMPIDPQTGSPVESNPLADFVDRILKPWIGAGAPNN